MRKIIILSLLSLLANISLAQSVPQKINYQAVARDGNGDLLVNSSISVDVTILSGSSTGTVIYEETHAVSTNVYGLFYFKIGEGSVVSGTMSGIAWGTADHYLNVQVNGDDLGTVQLVSVPYALQARNTASIVGNPISTVPPTNGQVLVFNGTSGQWEAQAASGSAGANSIMTSTVEPAGANCVSGGYLMEYGTDDDFSGVLDAIEVDGSYYVCNGTDGVNGTNGTNGTNGIDGVSVVWLGSMASAPASPNLNEAYYNTTTKTSEVWDGAAWQTVAIDGIDGVNGTNGTNGTNGIDGVSLVWLGSMASAPASPNLNEAYYNTTTKTSEVWDGAAWQTVAIDGIDGVNGTNGTNGIDGVSLVWLGSMASAPASPNLNEAYYNTTTKTSEIWDGAAWQTVAIDGIDGVNGTNGTNGIDGVSVVWLGSMASAPASPNLNEAFYNTTTKTSEIWDGAAWQTVAIDGIDGVNGTNGTNGTNGIDGVSVVWLGSMASAPASPNLNEAYYNTTTKTSEIWDGAAWQTVAIDGIDGVNGTNGTNGTNGIDGVSVVWLGSMASAPASPNLNEAYYNTTTKTSEIWDGAAWQTVAIDGIDGVNGTNGTNGTNGIDGVSVVWLGSMASAPASPNLNEAYYNTTTKTSEIWDGAAWQTVAIDGIDGVNGTNGTNGTNGIDGVSVVWLGSMASAPASPNLNEAYYNTTTKTSEIWDGAAWQTVAIDGIDGVNGTNGTNGTNGIDGVSVVWLGSMASAPASPNLNEAYYNSTTKTSEIWDGTAWQTVAIDGIDGVNGTNGTNGTNGIDGVSVVWLGSMASAPASPNLNEAYYNSTTKTSEIWDGTAWQTIAIDGVDGVAGAAGTNGLDGNTWTVAAGAPGGGVNAGDMYLDNTTNDYYSFDGAVWNLEGNLGATETVTSVMDNGDGTFTYTDENSNGTIIDMNANDPDIDPLNEIQDLQLVGNILTITNNGAPTSINLTPYLELPTGAATGDMVTWNGSQWVAGPVSGDNWGAQTALTDNTTILGNGVAGTPLTADIQVAEITDIILTTPAPGDHLEYNGTNWVNVTPPAIGEANTASNQGVAGVGPYIQKTGVDLEFKNINAGSTRVTITDDPANNEIDVDIDPNQIQIGELNDVVLGSPAAGEHLVFNGTSWVNSPSAGDGNGIYSGNGTVPGVTQVTLTDNIDFDASTFYIDGTTNTVGIGTYNTNGKLNIDHGGDVTSPGIFMSNPNNGAGTGLNRITMVNPLTPNKMWEMAGGVNTGGDAVSAWTVSYDNGTTYDQLVAVYGDKKIAVGNITAANSSTFDVFGTTTMHDALTIDNGTLNPYTLPVVDGAANFVMQTDGAGVVTWVDPSSFGGGVPAGADGEIQFNLGGVFGASNVFYWDNTNLRLGLGTATPSTTLDVAGDANATGVYMLDGITFLDNRSTSTLVGNTMNTTLTGLYNTLVGEGAGQFTTTGMRNTVVGRYAGNTLSVEFDNTFVGTGAGQFATSGSNTYIGSYSGWNATTGANNVGLGYNAAYSLTTGANNTVIGTNADFSDGTISNATGLGSNVVLSQSNSVILGNGADVGIGTSTPAEKLHVKGGSLMIDDGANPYTLPGADGAANFVMQTDGAGIVSWVDPSTFGGGGSAWNLTGNALTNPISDFIGTTDAVDLEFRTNSNLAIHVNALDQNVGIGTGAPLGKLHVLSDGAENMIISHSVNGVASDLTAEVGFARARGNVGLETGVLANDRVGKVSFNGYHDATSDYQEAGYITMTTPTNYGAAEAGSSPGNMWFFTTPIGSYTPQQAMMINENQNVGIGSSFGPGSAPTSKLHIDGDIALGVTSMVENAVTVYLNNNTGANTSKGDIVIIDPNNDGAFTTTASQGHSSVVGVVYESGVPIGQPCKVAISGVALVKTDVATTRGQHVITGGALGRAGSIPSPSAGTSIGIWLQNAAAGSVGYVILK